MREYKNFGIIGRKKKISASVIWRPKKLDEPVKNSV